MSVPQNSSPYIGLNPYSEENAEYFFGRQGERASIISNLLADRLTLLYGASGVGKTSVLRAGVQHHLGILARKNLENLGRPKFVGVYFYEWREKNPLQSLLLKVQESVAGTLGLEIKPPDPSLNFTESLLNLSRQARGHLLIILDQFEEYFLYHQNEDGPGTFAMEFPRAVNTVGFPVNFLISFREDAFAKLAVFKDRMPDVFGNYLPLTHLDYEAGREAIEKPIQQYNEEYVNIKPAISIEPALVEKVLAEVVAGEITVGDVGRGKLNEETGPTGIETAFLQMVMTRLWEEEMRAKSHVLRLETLNALADPETKESGSKRIVRTHLDETMGGLSADQQDIAGDVFHYLVTPGGTKIAHTVADLAQYAHRPEAELVPVLKDLANSRMRILRGVPGSADKPEPRYEIFHDVLAAPILDWSARRMMAKEQAEAARKAQLHAREQEKARTAMLRRAATAVLVIMLVIALALLVWALKQRSAARAAAQDAAEAQNQAEKRRIEADEKSILLGKQAEELTAARVTAETEKQSAIKQSNLATANAIRASQEKTRAVKNLQTAINSLEEDLQAANDNYDSVFNDLDDPCDRVFSLRFNKLEYENLLRRYESLGADTQRFYVRKRIREIDRNSEEFSRKCQAATRP